MKHAKYAGRPWGGVGLVAAWAVMTTPALAQNDTTTTDAAPIELKALVVVGEKVERSLFDTTSSVSVVTAEDLEKQPEATSVQEVIGDLPNVLYTGTVGAPVIRGQDTQGPNSGAGAFFSGTVPRASINVDGHYLTYYDFVRGASSVWDVESIEVFRGPQTSSQGANSIAGAIIVNTKDPTFDWEGDAQALFGSYFRRRASGALSGPISDSIAVRGAIDYAGRETYIDYTSPSFQKGETDQDFSALNGRFKILAVPEAIPGLEAKLTYSANQSNRPTSEAAFDPYEDYESVTASMPSWEQTSHVGIFDLSYDFDNGLRFVEQAQYAYTNANRIVEPSNTGSAVVDQRDFSTETRLLYGNANDFISGVGGIRFARTMSDEKLQLRGTSYFDDIKENLGLYSEVSVHLTDRLTLTGGLRYQRDRIQRSGISPLATGVLNYDEVFQALLPKISLAYDITPTVTVGAMVNKGYNPGGVTLNMQSGDYVAFDPETVWNYELFARASFLNDRLFLNTNLFFSQFTDAQRYVQVSIPEIMGQSITVNAEKAHSYGLEVAADYQVLDTVRLNVSGGLLRTQITEFSNALADYEGNQFSSAPGHMVTVGVDWTVIPDLTVSGEVQHTGGYYSADDNDPDYKVNAYTTANVRANYQVNDAIKVFGYVTNILGSAEPTYKSNNRSVGGTEAAMQAPREFGVGLRMTF